MSYRFADSLRAGSEWNCPKHEEFYSKNKFEKLAHLVGFIIRIYHDARSPERQMYSSVLRGFQWFCGVLISAIMCKSGLREELTVQNEAVYKYG